MPLFEIDKQNLIEISEVTFDLEKEIQRLVENNMKTIFNLDFITSEFELNGFRIDSLGFDLESKSFTIIEYKKDRNFSVIDQGYAYLSLLLNNKAEYILKFNENKKEGFLKKDNVDWTQSRVIFISPVFTAYQRKAIEFKDLPIELWEVKKYSNQTILFNQIQTPTQSESILTITQKSEIIQSVTKEIEVYNEESHLQLVNQNIKELYYSLKEPIMDFDPKIKVVPRKKYIGFIKNQKFLNIHIKRGFLKLTLFTDNKGLNDPHKIAKEIIKYSSSTKKYYRIIIKTNSDVGYILSLIRQAYDIN
jgi:predicted transport protein